MGMLVEGKWKVQSVITSDEDGKYDREPRSFRDTISKDDEKFKPESGRYHLYVGYACPWATRALIVRDLKDLNDHISVSVVHPDMLDNGWKFDDSFDGATKDHLFNSEYLKDVYLKADPNITTSVTVPVLWDKKLNTIVNNESSEIIRIFNTAFNDLTGNELDLYPLSFQQEIDKVNERVYHAINNGVYKTGFAKNQKAYDEAVTDLFDALDEMEARLENKKFLVGDELTEADIRLMVTLTRFDIVYVTHFKCNVRRIKDYKNLSRYTKALFEISAIKDSHNFDHIKRHYYYSHESINPNRIVPKGPADIF